MKIMFDSSIHLGQFHLGDDHIRVAAKNSQVMISSKPATAITGVEAFNENSYSDDIIWTLEREPQDCFYRFMDVYHSVKTIDRIPLNVKDAESALVIQRELGLHMSNALTCAVAIANHCDELHSIYAEFSRKDVIQHLQKQHGIRVTLPSTDKELHFPETGLEQFYVDALATFRRWNAELTTAFHP